MQMYNTNENRNSAAGTMAHTVVAVYCKLFSDTITSGVCILRKQELNGRGGFSCTGCSLEKC